MLAKLHMLLHKEGELSLPFASGHRVADLFTACRFTVKFYEPTMDPCNQPVQSN